MQRQKGLIHKASMAGGVRMLDVEKYPQERLVEIREHVMAMRDEIMELWDDGIQTPLRTEDERLSRDICNARDDLIGIAHYLSSKIYWEAGR